MFKMWTFEMWTDVAACQSLNPGAVREQYGSSSERDK